MLGIKTVDASPPLRIKKWNNLQVLKATSSLFNRVAVGITCVLGSKMARFD